MLESLDRDVPVPLYYQLYLLLKEDMTEHYKQGDHYSTEMELQQRYDVSRATIRKTLEMLERDGIIQRITGKGIIIAPVKLKVDLPNLLSFSEEMHRRGMRPSTKLLEVALVIPPQTVKLALHLEDEEQTLLVSRVRYGDAIPIVFSESYLPKQLGLHLEDDYSTSLYGLIETRTGKRLEDAHHVIEGALIEEDISEHLAVQPGFPALRFYRTVYEQQGSPLVYETGIIRADHYSYNIMLKRSGRN